MINYDFDCKKDTEESKYSRPSNCKTKKEQLLGTTALSISKKIKSNASNQNHNLFPRTKIQKNLWKSILCKKNGKDS